MSDEDFIIVYSKKIVRFVNEIKSVVKDVLAKEVCVKVAGNRFYDERGRASYPVQVVVYNNKSMLGYFDADFYELGFHECLMHASRTQLHQVIRHELAHYMAFIQHGRTIEPHGPEFRAFCRQRGWGEEIYRATVCLEGGQNGSVIEESSVFRKVQKLMALAASSNKHEAELAMIKSQQLLLKHNMESAYLGEEDEEKVVLKRIMKQKKENAKMRSIARILETFFVGAVYSRAGDFTYLEILGSAVNVKIADYVATFLHGELDKLWEQAQEQNHLRGAVAKNSFFLGLAKGYCNKIQALKREYTSDVANAVMVIEKKLIDARDLAYQRLSFTKRGGSYCGTSAGVGEQMGRQLNINSAIGGSSKNSEALISHSG